MYNKKSKSHEKNDKVNQQSRLISTNWIERQKKKRETMWGWARQNESETERDRETETQRQKILDIYSEKNRWGERGGGGKSLAYNIFSLSKTHFITSQRW